MATSRIIKYMIWVSGSFSRSHPGLARPASAAESGDCLVWNDCGTENPNSEGVPLPFLSPARYRLSLHYRVQITLALHPHVVCFIARCHSSRYSGATAMTDRYSCLCLHVAISLCVHCLQPQIPSPRSGLELKQRL